MQRRGSHVWKELPEKNKRGKHKTELCRLYKTPNIWRTCLHNLCLVLCRFPGVPWSHSLGLWPYTAPTQLDSPGSLGLTAGRVNAKRAPGQRLHAPSIQSLRVARMVSLWQIGNNAAAHGKWKQQLGSRGRGNTVNGATAAVDDSMLAPRSIWNSNAWLCED